MAVAVLVGRGVEVESARGAAVKVGTGVEVAVGAGGVVESTVIVAAAIRGCDVEVAAGSLAQATIPANSGASNGTRRIVKNARFACIGRPRAEMVYLTGYMCFGRVEAVFC